MAAGTDRPQSGSPLLVSVPTDSVELRNRPRVVNYGKDLIDVV